MSIIGIVLGVIAIGLIFWFKKDQQMSNDLHEAEINHTHQGMNALMDNFNNYQIETDRKIAQLEKNLEYQNNKFNKRIDKNEKDLPNNIRKTIGHIEFAKPLDK
jgi:hypothetical protein